MEDGPMTDPAEVVREFIESSEGRGLDYTNAAEEALDALVRERNRYEGTLREIAEEGERTGGEQCQVLARAALSRKKAR